MSAVASEAKKGSPPKRGDGPKVGGIGAMVVDGTDMKLINVENPNRLNPQDQECILVLRSGNEFDVPEGGQIQAGDQIICEQEAGATLQGKDANGPGYLDIASFENYPAEVTVDWSQVTNVDEYYNGSGMTYDITVDSTSAPAETVTIVG